MYIILLYVAGFRVIYSKNVQKYKNFLSQVTISLKFTGIKLFKNKM